MTRGPLRAVPLLAALLFVHAAPALAENGYTAGSASCGNFSIIGDYQPPDATMPLIGDTWLLFTCNDAQTVTGGPWALTVKVTIQTPGSYIGYSAPTLYHGDSLTQAALNGPFSVMRNGNWYYEWINSISPTASGYGTQVSSCGLRADIEILLGLGIKPNGQPNNVVLGTAKNVIAGCSGNGAVVEGSAPQIEAARHDYHVAIQALEKAAKAGRKGQKSVFLRWIEASKREAVKAKHLSEGIFDSIDPSTLKFVDGDSDRAIIDDKHMEMTVEEEHTFTPGNYAPELTNDESELHAAAEVM